LNWCPKGNGCRVDRSARTRAQELSMERVELWTSWKSRGFKGPVTAIRIEAVEGYSSHRIATRTGRSLTERAMLALKRTSLYKLEAAGLSADSTRRRSCQCRIRLAFSKRAPSTGWCFFAAASGQSSAMMITIQQARECLRPFLLILRPTAFTYFEQSRLGVSKYKFLIKESLLRSSDSVGSLIFFKISKRLRCLMQCQQVIVGHGNGTLRNAVVVATYQLYHGGYT
jgi:hypothetical protein